jgi:hypothetical protein
LCFVPQPIAKAGKLESASRRLGLFVFSRGLLTTTLPLLPRRLQLPISLGLDLLLPPGEHVLRRDVSDGAVQADFVVVVQVTF